MLYMAKDIQKFYYIYIVVKVMWISRGIDNSNKKIYTIYT